MCNPFRHPAFRRMVAITSRVVRCTRSTHRHTACFRRLRAVRVYVRRAEFLYRLENRVPQQHVEGHASFQIVFVVFVVFALSHGA